MIDEFWGLPKDFTKSEHDTISGAEDYRLKASITFRGLPKSRADATSVRTYASVSTITP